MFSNSYPMEFSPTNETSRSGEEMDTQKGPVLFGNKRRSMAVSRTPSFMNSNPIGGVPAPSSDIFASPAPAQSAVPSHMRESTPSGLKSVHWSPALVSDRNMSSPLVKPQTMTPSSNAPPLRSLRDDVEPIKKSSRRSLSTTVTHSLNQTNSSFIMSADSTVEETSNPHDNWVTVFGFTPDQAYAVLQFMSRHGEVVQHQMPSKGNWMYVGYSCSTHARQALSRNGTILDGNIRIGVIRTAEKELAEINVASPTPMPTLNRSTFLEQSIREETEDFQEPILQSRDQNVSVFDTSLNTPRSVSRAGMRPLNNSFRPRVETQEEEQKSFMSKLWNTVGF